MAAALDALDFEMFLALSRFYAEYARTIDEDQLEAWPEFFTENGTYRMVPRENTDGGYPIALVSCRNRAMMEDRVIAIRQASVFGPHRYRHILGAPSFERRGEEIRGTSSFAVLQVKLDPVEYGLGELYAFGEYRDVIVFESGLPRLTAREVILDASRVQTLLVTPI